MLRIAKLGCDSAYGQVAIHFVRELAKYIEFSHCHFRPSQFLSATPITAMRDMTSDRVCEYISRLKDYVMDALIDINANSEDLVGITDWLAVVAPMEDPPVTGDDDLEEYKGIDPTLMM